jgi:very-short-patch-repair endonuclease
MRLTNRPKRRSGLPFASPVESAQEPILTFRVDFLLVAYNPVRDHCRRLVVECDGHDYHSTFEAQRRDAERDRYLRPHLWGIVHYAGAEIRRSPERVAGELVTMMVAG